MTECEIGHRFLVLQQTTDREMAFCFIPKFRIIDREMAYWFILKLCMIIYREMAYCLSLSCDDRH